MDFLHPQDGLSGWPTLSSALAQLRELRGAARLQAQQRGRAGLLLVGRGSPSSKKQQSARGALAARKAPRLSWLWVKTNGTMSG